MAAYYNEIEPFAAAWLRNLIAAGHIAPGDVDERSIEDVSADDLRGYHQCHFFAGIGVWSHALRLAGWSDDRPVWTGSCPCQPFSVAGRRAGKDDARHLWPAWFRLIEECRPAVVFGEQVANGGFREWFDAVSTDLEGADYAVGAADLCAAGFGAPHIRQRLYFVAESHHERRDGVDARLRAEGGSGRAAEILEAAGSRQAGDVADADELGTRYETEVVQERKRESSSCSVLGNTRGARGRRNGRAVPGTQAPAQREGGERRGPIGGRVLDEPVAAGDPGVLGDTSGARPQKRPESDDGRPALRIEGPAAAEAGVVRGFWRDADLVYCRDGKYRPAQPGIFPLAPRTPGRVGRLRAYGNAIVAPVAAAFVSAYMDLGSC